MAKIFMREEYLNTKKWKKEIEHEYTGSKAIY